MDIWKNSRFGKGRTVGWNCVKSTRVMHRMKSLSHEHRRARRASSPEQANQWAVRVNELMEKRIAQHYTSISISFYPVWVGAQEIELMYEFSLKRKEITSVRKKMDPLKKKKLHCKKKLSMDSTLLNEQPCILSFFKKTYFHVFIFVADIVFLMSDHDDFNNSKNFWKFAYR